MIWVLANVHFDDGLLEYFMRYYRSKGVEEFGLIRDREYLDGPTDNEYLMEFRRKKLTKNDWYIPADLDEFHWLPGLRSFEDLIGEYDFVPSVYVDRLSNDGGIHTLSDENLDVQFPLGSNITKAICKGCVDKVMFARGDVEVNSGHHYARGYFPAPFTGQTHHFKWQGIHFWDWMFRGNRRADDCHGVEFAPFLSHYQQFGRINVTDKGFGIHKALKIGV